MPTVADYAVLLDQSVVIEVGDALQTQPFFRPDNFVVGTNLAKAVLAFKVQPLPISSGGTTFAPNVDLTIRKGPFEEVVRIVNLTASTIHGLWEAFPATGFGENIGTRFEFSLSEGRARISDVILWYQVSV